MFLVVATGGAVTIEGADIRRCGLGVRAKGAASVTVGPSTRIRENTTGMSLQQTSTTTLSSSGAQISLEQNSSMGIDVNDQAKLTIDGDASAETIVAKQNTIGIWFHHVPGLGVLPTSEVKGLVAKQNVAGGVQINGGSAVRVRGSVLVANLYGINVPSGSIANYENDTSRIDLGTDTGTDAGGNTLQDKSAASGGTPNSGAGLCFAIQPNKSQQLAARGNKFATADATGTVDCKTAAADTAIGAAATCAGGANVAGQGRTGNTVHLDNCVE